MHWTKEQAQTQSLQQTISATDISLNEEAFRRLSISSCFFEIASTITACWSARIASFMRRLRVPMALCGLLPHQKLLHLTSGCCHGKFPCGHNGVAVVDLASKDVPHYQIAIVECRRDLNLSTPAESRPLRLSYVLKATPIFF